MILLLLVAIAVGAAIALSGGGSRRAAGGASAAQVSLHLVGAKAEAALSACGRTHHYKIYPAGGTIGFRGTSSLRAGTPAKVKVKVKLKACVGGAFQPAGDAAAAVAADGSFQGNFPAPAAGNYSARAELKQGGALVARSRKRYFEVR